MVNRYKILLYGKEKWAMPRNDSKKIELDWVTGALIKLNKWMDE